MKRTASAILLVILLTSMLYSAFKIMPVGAAGTIYIRADGSIDPPTAPISHAGNVYTLNGNISSATDANGIVIERDNIILDGSGYTLQASGGSGSGISLVDRSYVTVRNAKIKGYHNGLGLGGSSNNGIIGNYMANEIYGITLYNSSANIIAGNTLVNTGCCIMGYSSTNNSIVDNKVVDSGIGIWLNSLSNYNNVVLNTLVNSGIGIDLLDSSDNIIVGNTVANNYAGIELAELYYYTYGNSLYHNNFMNNTNQALLSLSFSEVGPTNIWDNGYPSGGNYWSDYNGTDSDLDGIGDSSYVIHSDIQDNQDRYPLMNPYMQGDVNYDLIVDVFDCVRVLVAFGSTPSSPNWNPRCNVNEDNLIDILDLVAVSANFGKEWTPP
jgi:parallel beta-helix repeat protein